MTSSPPPGWYQDPADAHFVRYWDGVAWTHQVQPRPVVSPPPPPPDVRDIAAPPPSHAASPFGSQPEPEPDPEPEPTPAVFDLSGRAVEAPPMVENPPVVPGQVNPGFGVVGVSGQDAFAQQQDRGTAADAFAAYTSAPQYGYAVPQPGSGWQSGPGGLGDFRFVGPIRAVKLGFRKYVRFSGRSSRSEFWWWMLFWYGVIFVLSVAASVYVIDVLRRQCAAVPLGDCTASFTPLWIIAAFLLIFLLATFIPTIAIVCRRLQDSDRSGYWIWLYFATLFINTVPHVGRLISLVIDILFLVWLAWAGTPGPNRYGPIPDEGR